MVAEAFANRIAVKTYADEVTRIVHLGTEELIAFVEEDPRMLLLLKDKSRDEPWDESTGRTRPIVIPSVLRRCISNLLAEVLEVTCDHLLPDCAVAYRPGNRDVVAETIIDVASEIALAGKFYYWKYDLRSAFPSLPWKLVQQSLKEMGLPEEFADFTMALVAAPIVREVHGKLVLVPNNTGCQAGLPESATLLNIVMKPIDEEVTRAFPALTYRRYSDDGILAGACRHLVVGAARRILTWARTNRLHLKDVSPDQGAQSLVRDIREQALPLLGAEIHADGEIRIPHAKVERQIKKLTFMIANTPKATPAGDDIEIIAGTSKYAPGSRSNGLCIYDRHDFQESFESFFAYVFPLNEGDAFTFLDRIRHELRINPQLPPCTYRKLTWVAALGGPGVVQAGGHRNLHHTHPAYLQQWFLYTTKLKDNVPIDLEEIEGTESKSGVGGEERGDSAHLVDEHVGVPTSSKCWVADGGQDRDVGDPLLYVERDETVDDADGPVGPGPESGVLLPPTEDDEHALFEEGTSSVVWSDAERSSLRSVWLEPATPADMSSGADGMVQAPEPPGPCLHENTLVVHLVARRVARRRDDGGTVVGLQRFDRTGKERYAPRVRFHEGMHESSSVIEMIERLREEAMGDGFTALLVLLDDADLPKALLQRHRAFRQPGLFQRVLEIHAPHPVSVVVAGPWLPPSTLLRRVDDECETRRRALRQNWGPPSRVAVA